VGPQRAVAAVSAITSVHTVRADYRASDGDLVERAREGEHGAFDALFDRHYGRVYGFAFRLTHSAADSEDIAQQAFVRAYGALSRIEDGQALLRWLYRVVVNLVRDRAKRQARKPWVSFWDLRPRPAEGGSAAEPPEFADPGLDPHGIALREARSRALDRAIARLPLDQREVIALHHLEGMEVREISALLGVPEGTVKSRLGRARQRLREDLAEWLDEETTS